jgi:hypothetical protein
MLTAPNASKEMEQQELSFISVGIQDGTATLEDSLLISKNTLLYDPAIALLGI